jgi:hypothetical protein
MSSTFARRITSARLPDRKELTPLRTVQTNNLSAILQELGPSDWITT